MEGKRYEALRAYPQRLSALLPKIYIETFVVECSSKRGRWKYFRVGGTEICVIIPTSGGLRPPDPLLAIETYILRIVHFTSVKVIWRLLDELKLFSSINTVARSTFIQVFTSFKITYYPFTSS